MIRNRIVVYVDNAKCPECGTTLRPGVEHQCEREEDPYEDLEMEMEDDRA